MVNEHLLAKFQCGDRLFACYTRKVVEELIEPVARFQIIQERFNRDTCTDEDGRSTQDVGVAVDDGGFFRHW